MKTCSTPRRFPPAHLFILVASLGASFTLAGCGGDAAAPAGDPPAVTLGERLFLETRFAQFFAVNLVNGDVNAPLVAGDPVMDNVTTTGASFAGPFAGRSMSCRQCHFVDDAAATPGGSVRTYTDFARRSPIPARSDGATTTPRNSPPMVNASLARTVPFLLHFDGEFATGADLVRGAFSGRNFGWLPNEGALAVAHIARVVREDNGSNEFAAGTGGFSYGQMFGGHVPVAMRIPPARRINVATATDQQIFDAVADIVNDYIASLEFARDENGDFSGSPYDAFLRKNSLPLHADAGESDLGYQRRLRGLVNGLATPVFVTPADGTLTLHGTQAFAFGAPELQGLKIFLAEPAAPTASPSEISSGGFGSCIACHQGPQFTDFLAHNVGAAQEEYDSVHGGGAFAALTIPDLATRSTNEDLFLPATGAHPTRMGVFRRVPNLSQPMFTDLGLWSVLGNGDLPTPQQPILDVLCAVNNMAPGTCRTAQGLGLSVALFKTPGLRSLGQGAPYFHTGRKDTLDDVVSHYMTFSAQARASLVRNADPRLLSIALTGADVAPLVAFLSSLNEDYQ